MVSVQIKNVPEETHAVLRRRAAAAHQSLQEYLLALLQEQAELANNAEIFDEIQRRGGGGTFTAQDVVAIIEEGRASRESC